MINFIKTFRKDEDGAVTVDWVVLTAAVVGLGIAAVTTVSGGINTAATTLTNDLSTDMTTASSVGG
ncbi:Flp family type IVb pilin [Thalassovita aquimarina]|uniref:Pilus assembly protein n=1 Tax=Thalassovita aquimarina TaxID=2785917 RepID=A0ABS5HW71_9RHOB|nr:pilus assembly protein [Thalassovita aquimarina]MBR9653032.1 pilus assembly protein [Thalassovita aquimarina]